MKLYTIVLLALAICVISVFAGPVPPVPEHEPEDKAPIAAKDIPHKIVRRAGPFLEDVYSKARKQYKHYKAKKDEDLKRDKREAVAQ
uniref:Conserved secreted protein n=1 Tax=Panagrellus redivivus TaxID=6233 RepID=A0A7E4VCK8_PANRE